MRRLGLPVCACVAIVLLWLHGTGAAPRRISGAASAAPDPETAASAAAPDPPAAVLSEVSSVRREASGTDPGPAGW